MESCFCSSAFVWSRVVVVMSADWWLSLPLKNFQIFNVHCSQSGVKRVLRNIYAKYYLPSLCRALYCVLNIAVIKELLLYVNEG